MAIGSGKSNFLAQLAAQKAIFIEQVIKAEDDMTDALLASKDPAQNEIQRRIKWGKIYEEIKKVEEITYDGLTSDIQQNGQVLPGIAVNIPVTSAPGTPSVGVTITPGSIL